MKEEIVVHGVVLAENSQREFDKRLSLLTMEQGKMTVWASGAKRPTSPGYNLQAVKVDAYFTEIASDLEKACYAAYFLELASVVSQENLPAEGTVNLIYLSLKALLHKNLNNRLVRAVFELRLLFLEGEYTEEPPYSKRKAVQEAWQYVLSMPLGKLYTFTLEGVALEDFCENVSALRQESFPVHFQSMKILESLRE